MKATAEKELTPEQLAAKERREYIASGRVFSVSRISQVTSAENTEYQAIEDESAEKTKRMRQSYFHTCYRLCYLYYKGLETGHTVDGWLETSTALLAEQTKSEKRTVQRHIKLLMEANKLLKEPFILAKKAGGRVKRYNYQLQINPYYLLQFEAEKAAELFKTTADTTNSTDARSIKALLDELQHNPAPPAIAKVLKRNSVDSISYSAWEFDDSEADFGQPPPD